MPVNPVRPLVPKRRCRQCDRWFDDIRPRTVPAGYCSAACHAASKPAAPAKRNVTVRKSGTPAKRRAISPAAPEQRAKAKGACIVTGSTEGVDPAHLWPRGLGGCDDPLCVAPLRRDVHEAYDRHEVDLLPFLIAHGYYAEIAHAVMHARGDLVAVLQMLTGERWVAVPGVSLHAHP